jgi:hypothetical protein
MSLKAGLVLRSYTLTASYFACAVSRLYDKLLALADLFARHLTNLVENTVAWD